MKEPINQMLEDYSIAEMLKMDLSTVLGKWKWTKAVANHLDEWHCRQYRDIYYGIISRTREEIVHSKESGDVKYYLKWEKDIFNVRNQNAGSLQSLLKCVGNCDEMHEKALPEKKQGVMNMRNLFTDYLKQEWGLTDDQITQGICNPYGYAQQWVTEDIADKGYLRYI